MSNEFSFADGAEDTGMVRQTDRRVM